MLYEVITHQSNTQSGRLQHQPIVAPIAKSDRLLGSELSYIVLFGLVLIIQGEHFHHYRQIGHLAFDHPESIRGDSYNFV